MKKQICLLVLVLAIAGCEPERGSAKWCDAMEAASTSDWSMEDGITYARYCLVPDLAIGSEKWCDRLSKKDKGDWTADEATSFARHCVIRLGEDE